MTAETILELFTMNPKAYNANLLLPVQNSPGGLGSTGAMEITELLTAFDASLISTTPYSFALQGSVTSTDWDVVFYKVGKLIMMRYQTILHVVDTAGGSIISATSFPAGYEPQGAATQDLFYSATVIDGDSSGNQIKPGIINLFPSPSFSLSISPYDPGHFSNAYCGIKGGAIMYYGN